MIVYLQGESSAVGDGDDVGRDQADDPAVPAGDLIVPDDTGKL